MRNLSCLLIVAVLVLHMSVYNMDHHDDGVEFEPVDITDVLQTGRRDSHQLSGNQSGSSSDCNFVMMSDGLGGPAWESTTSYTINDIVEWPAGSQNFWQTISGGATSEPGTTTKWKGPCSC